MPAFSDANRRIAERTKDGIAAARARGKRPVRQPLDADKIAAAIKLVKAGLSPTAAARQLGLGRSTVYREVNRAGIERLPPPAWPRVHGKFYLSVVYLTTDAMPSSGSDQFPRNRRRDQAESESFPH